MKLPPHAQHLGKVNVVDLDHPTAATTTTTTTTTTTMITMTTMTATLPKSPDRSNSYHGQQQQQQQQLLSVSASASLADWRRAGLGQASGSCSLGSPATSAHAPGQSKITEDGPADVQPKEGLLEATSMGLHK